MHKDKKFFELIINKIDKDFDKNSLFDSDYYFIYICRIGI